MSASPERISAPSTAAPAMQNGTTKAAANGEANIRESAGSRKSIMPRTQAHVPGEIVCLLPQSAAHKHLFVSDLDWFVGAPMVCLMTKCIFLSP